MVCRISGPAVVIFFYLLCSGAFYRIVIGSEEWELLQLVVQ